MKAKDRIKNGVASGIKFNNNTDKSLQVKSTASKRVDDIETCMSRYLSIVRDNNIRRQPINIAARSDSNSFLCFIYRVAEGSSLENLCLFSITGKYFITFHLKRR